MQILIKISWQNGIEFNIFFTIILRIQRDKLCKVLNAVLSTRLSGTRCYCDDLPVSYM